MDLLTIAGGIGLMTWLGSKNDVPETNIENSVKSMQKSISDTLITNEANATAVATSNQTITGITVKNVIIKGCTNALNFTQDSNMMSKAISTIDSDVTIKVKTNFSETADQTIDAVVDIEREFLSPEDKRKYITTLKGDMEQIIEETFTMENLSDAFASATNSQVMSDINVGSVIIDCEGLDESSALTFSQQAQVHAVADALVKTVLTKFSVSEGFQEFTARIDSDYTYKGTGPIGEMFRGFAELIKAWTGPLVIVGVVIVLGLVLMSILGSKKKAPKVKNVNLES